MNHPVIDFMRDMREAFGEFEFKATNSIAQVTSTEWPEDPDHPANAPDSKFVVPQLQPKRDEDRSA